MYIHKIQIQSDWASDKMSQGESLGHCTHNNNCMIVQNLHPTNFVWILNPLTIRFLARLLILIKKGGLLQLKFGVVGVGVGVNIYLWAR